MATSEVIAEIRVLQPKCLIGIDVPRPVPKLAITLYVHAEVPAHCGISVLFKRFTGTGEPKAKGVRMPDELPRKFIHLPLVAGDLLITEKSIDEVIGQLISMVISPGARIILERSEKDRNSIALTLQIKEFETTQECPLSELVEFFEMGEGTK